MENTNVEKNTTGHRLQVYLSFAISSSMTLGGIWMLPCEIWERAFLFLGVIFTIGSCLNLAKTVRDDHEAQKLINRIHKAKTERILKDYEE